MAKRVVLGKKGSDYVLQISKSGVDVIDDSPNTKDLLFNSLDTYRSGVIVSEDQELLFLILLFLVLCHHLE